MTKFKNGDKATIDYNGETFDVIYVGVNPTLPTCSIVYIKGSQKVDGEDRTGAISVCNSFISKPKRTIDFWVNIYERGEKLKMGGSVWRTEIEALAGLSSAWNHIKTKKFTYTEPD